MPYSSMPCLKAYLEAGEVKGKQYDFNIEVYDRLLRPEPLRQLWKQTPWKKDFPAPTPGAPGRKEVGSLISPKIDEITGGGCAVGFSLFLPCAILGR